MLKKEVEVAKGKQRQGILKFLVVLLLTGFLLLAVFWLLPKWVSEPAVDEGVQAKAAGQSITQTRLDQANNQTPVMTSLNTQEQALDAIKVFDQQLSLMAQYQSLQNDVDLMQAIDATQSRVSSAFTQADYDTVVFSLEQMMADNEGVIMATQEALENHLQAAAQLWQDKQLLALQTELSRAQAIKADLPEWLELNALLAAWPEVELLLRTAKTAQLEGRYQDQLQALIKISQLANDLPQLSQQIGGVKKQLAEDRYRQAIAKADAAKRKLDLKQMRAAIDIAQQLYPQRPEVIHLVKELAELERQHNYQRHLKVAESYLANDQWASAFTELKAAHELYPNQRDTQDKKDFVAAYLKLMKASSEILNQPSLLSSAVKRKRTADMLTSMSLYRNLSPSMVQVENRLGKQLERYSQKVKLTVLSDNKTHVEVRSIGKVGVIAEKTISLLPGSYLFEGKRSGYVTKMVKVVISPEDATKQVKVIADERI